MSEEEKISEAGSTLPETSQDPESGEIELTEESLEGVSGGLNFSKSNVMKKIVVEGGVKPQAFGDGSVRNFGDGSFNKAINNTLKI